MDVAETEYFWKGVAGGALMLRRCARCQVVQHPAQATPLCGRCRGTEFESFAASGRGTVYTWIISRHPARPDDPPRIVALVELEEGVRLVSNVIGVDPAGMRNELPVQVCFAEHDGQRLPRFRPAGDSR